MKLNEDTFKRTLDPDIGCSNCSLRRECDLLSQRRDIKFSLSFGCRGCVECLRLYSAYKPEHLRLERIER